MALSANEQWSGGRVRDLDGRMVVTLDTSGGAGTGTAGYPSGATVITASSGNKAASTANATLAAAAGAFTYITGFEVTGAGATAASNILVTVTGVQGGTMTYNLVIPAGVNTSITPLQVEFSPAIPSSAVNTAIQVAVPSFGAGNTNASTVAHGFQL